MNAPRGQALTEFAVGVASLGLLAIGTLTIAGFQEAQRRSIAGARHAVFESMWRNDRTASVSPVERIFRSHFDDAGFLRTVSDARWIQASDVQIADSNGSAPGYTAAATDTLLAPLRLAGGFLGSSFDLSNTGFRTATLRVALPTSPQLPRPFADMELALSQPMAILSDAWNASGSQHVLNRTAGLVPTGALRSLSASWRTLAVPLSLVEPGLDQLCLGLIEPEMIPEDRLGPATLRVPASETCR